jgi:putative FmdB family regulatory protein
MPTYDYTCDECDHSFEERQKITEAPLSLCPKCKQKGLKRGIGGGLATFRFIGDGFYINDYKKEKQEQCPTSSKCCPCKENP